MAPRKGSKTSATTMQAPESTDPAVLSVQPQSGHVDTAATVVDAATEQVTRKSPLTKGQRGRPSGKRQATPGTSTEVHPPSAKRQRARNQAAATTVVETAAKQPPRSVSRGKPSRTKSGEPSIGVTSSEVHQPPAPRRSHLPTRTRQNGASTAAGSAKRNDGLPPVPGPVGAGHQEPSPPPDRTELGERPYVQRQRGYLPRGQQATGSSACDNEECDGVISPHPREQLRTDNYSGRESNELCGWRDSFFRQDAGHPVPTTARGRELRFEEIEALYRAALAERERTTTSSTSVRRITPPRSSSATTQERSSSAVVRGRTPPRSSPAAADHPRTGAPSSRSTHSPSPVHARETAASRVDGHREASGHRHVSELRNASSTKRGRVGFRDVHSSQEHEESDGSIESDNERSRDSNRRTRSRYDDYCPRDSRAEDRICRAIENTLAAVREPGTRNDNTRLFSRMTASKTLQPFFGDPLEWIRFKQSFEMSTALGEYSDRENVMRLAGLLKGDAKDAVRVLFIAGNSAEDIMKTLEMRFGNTAVNCST